MGKIISSSVPFHSCYTFPNVLWLVLPTLQRHQWKPVYSDQMFFSPVNVWPARLGKGANCRGFLNMTSVFTLWQKFCRQQYSIRKFQRLGTNMHLPNVGRIAKGVNARAMKCCVQKYPTILPLPYTDSTLDWQKEELSPLQHLSIPPKIVVPSPFPPPPFSLP